MCVYCLIHTEFLYLSLKVGLWLFKTCLLSHSGLASKLLWAPWQETHWLRVCPLHCSPAVGGSPTSSPCWWPWLLHLIVTGPPKWPHTSPGIILQPPDRLTPWVLINILCFRNYWDYSKNTAYISDVYSTENQEKISDHRRKLGKWMRTAKFSKPFSNFLKILHYTYYKKLAKGKSPL